MTDYLIRNYNDSDLDFILEGHRHMYAEEYGYNDYFYNYAEKTVLDFLAATKWERENIWVAEHEGAPIGVIALISPEAQNHWLGQIRWFLVKPEFRKGGIGTVLMNTLLDNAKIWDYKHLILWTASNLEKALAFYTRYGFYETKRIEEPNWCDELIYELELERDVYRPDCINAN